MDRGKNISYFLIKDNQFIPRSSSHRASIGLNGDSTNCPYHSQLLTVVEPKYHIIDVKRIMNKGTRDFCWNSCDITECPAYQTNRKESLDTQIE